MFKTFEAARVQAIAQNKTHGCAVHICACIMQIKDCDTLEIQHTIIGYILSDWCDGTTVESIL